MPDRLLAVFATLSFVAFAAAQPANAPPERILPADRGAESADPYALGAKYESEAAGIAFQGPAGCREVRRTGSDQLVQYINDEKKWTLTATRAVLSKPVRLTAAPDAKGKMTPGLLETTVEQMKVDAPGIEILRQDFVNVSDVEVGMIAARSTLGMETRLTQRALIRASDRLYFNLSFVTPATKQGKLEDDPETQKIVDLFGRIIDSVRLIDQDRIVEEQAQRLYRTRLLLMRFNEANMRKAIATEQWWRLIRDGKDIGYSYVVEEVASDLPRRGLPSAPDPKGNGVRVGVRSRSFPDKGMQVDTESWFYVSFDRKNELWSNVGVAKLADGGKEDFGEFGFADREYKRVRDPEGEPGEERPDGSFDANQPAMKTMDQYTLSVTRTGRNARPPREIALPPFYLPQALNHLLGRLVELDEPKTFMFASWISDRGEVMKRYIDVESETAVTLGGKKVRAIPVRDRVGVEGSPTIHYISPDGKYLGAVNEDSKITILATDKKTLERLWQNANLTRPGEVERKPTP